MLSLLCPSNICQQIAARLNISNTEVTENFSVHEINVTDKLCITELWVDVDYQGRNSGRAHFGKNDLNLVMEPIRWGNDSEMIVDLHLPGEDRYRYY